jgi:hypothetical protein
MKADGMTAELIAKYTGLTAEEIAAQHRGTVPVCMSPCANDYQKVAITSRLRIGGRDCDRCRSRQCRKER